MNVRKVFINATARLKSARIRMVAISVYRNQQGARTVQLDLNGMMSQVIAKVNFNNNILGEDYFFFIQIFKKNNNNYS